MPNHFVNYLSKEYHALGIGILNNESSEKLLEMTNMIDSFRAKRMILHQSDHALLLVKQHSVWLRQEGYEVWWEAVEAEERRE